MAHAELVRQIQIFTHHAYRQPTVVQDFRPMADGHGGLTFGFRVESAAGEPLDALVLRLAPAGVTRKGNTDVYRQAPLLRALHSAGLPVPPLRWAESGEEWFGVPFVMTALLPGRTFIGWEPHASFRAPGVGAAVWRATAAALPGFHRFDWQTHLPDWAEPRPLRAEVEFWDPILARAPEPGWIAMGTTVREGLLASLPQDAPVGLLHGDYQPGNALFDFTSSEAGTSPEGGPPPEGGASPDGGRLVAILDWELAGIGGQLLDIGWLQMMGDAESWHADYQSLNPVPVDELAAIYEEGMGRRFPSIPWFRALAGYRFGSIACLNVKLHRRGQRVDPLWERMAPSIPSLFARAEQLLREWRTFD